LFALEHRAGVREHAVARLRKRQWTATTLEKWHRQFLLERRDGMAHAGLGDTQELGRSAKAARVDNSHERTELRERHMIDYS
jgi:hypothetical protein